MLSRRSLFKRAAVAGAALAAPGLPREATPLSAKTHEPLPAAKAQGERLTEWWYEHDSGLGAPIGISLINDGEVVSKHYLSPGNGIYFQYPPGYDPKPIQSVMIEGGGKVLDHFQVPNRLGAMAVRTHEGYFGIVTA